MHLFPKLALLAGLTLIGAASAVRANVTLYLQTFDPHTNPNPVERHFNHADLRPRLAGWTAYNGADGSTLAGGSGQPSVQTSGAIWSQPNTTGHVYQATGDAFTFDLSDAITLSVDSVQSSASRIGRVRFMIQIDNQWYASASTIQPLNYDNFSAAETAEADTTLSLALSTDASAWLAFTLDGTGVSLTALIADLPSSSVTGVGWWTYTTSISTVIRFDNFAITSAIPEPSAFAALFGVLGLATALGARRRRA